MSQRDTWREPVRLEIDYNALIWQILQEINTSFQSPTFFMEETHGKYGGRTESKSLTPIERFEDNVLTLRNYILPEWAEKDEVETRNRIAEWVPKYTAWRTEHAGWEEAHDRWKGTRDPDPLVEPLEPTKPEKPTSYNEDLKHCYNSKTESWQPWKLHKAIINLLHRRDFFKHTNPLEAIDGTTEEPQGEEQPNTVGSQSGTTTAPTTEKPSIT